MASQLNKFIESVIQTEEKGSINKSRVPWTLDINGNNHLQNQLEISTEIDSNSQNKMKTKKIQSKKIK